jgi:orotate phosphoribosyltransferase
MNFQGSAKLLQTMQRIEAIKEGHFLLSSGKHSGNYVQCARLFEFPDLAEQACEELAERLKDLKISVVAGPALGGVVVAYEMARQLGVRAVFSERQEGSMSFRRGFELTSQDKVLIVEDVVTTGGSAGELIALVKNQGAEAVAVATIIDRSPQGTRPFQLPFFSLLQLDFPAWEAGNCPLCQNSSVAIKPGSRPQ